MIEEIDLGDPPVGYTLAYSRNDKLASIAFREFSSTEDGHYFTQRLEGIPNRILARMLI